MRKSRKKIAVVFGTRPEVIKLAPVILELEASEDVFQTLNIATGQHNSLLYPFVRFFDIRIDHDLKVIEPGQTPTRVCARVLSVLEPVLIRESPDLILVQGDTITAVAGALSGFYHRIPVGHVEAGLRSGNVQSPFPEEINRQLITRLASYHFAPTIRNRATLLSEGISYESIFVTGNPVVDAIQSILERSSVSATVEEWLRATEGWKRIVLTTHRRESFGEVLAGNLRVLRSFVERHEDVAVIFPVHPNPSVVGPARAILGGHPRIYLIKPLNYDDFIFLLSNAWLILSDSGGVQTEAPSLGKPLLILRETTELPEVVEAGIGRLVGRAPSRLMSMLEEIYADDTWIRQVKKIENPFGRGDSGEQIVQALTEVMEVYREDSHLVRGHHA